MAPEQSAGDTEDSVKTTEPRRSGRIAARPSANVEVKSKAPRAVKKRTVEESTTAAEASTSKKVRDALARTLIFFFFF